MSKIVKKSDLEYRKGHLIYKGELVDPVGGFSHEINKLERWVQKGMYIAYNKAREANMEPVEPFEFQSAYGNKLNIKPPKTTMIDKRVAEHEKIKAESEAKAEHDKLKLLVKEFDSVVDFVADDEVIITDFVPCKLDLLNIGNPLKLTKDKLIENLKLAIPVLDEPVYSCCSKKKLDCKQSNIYVKEISGGFQQAMLETFTEE